MGTYCPVDGTELPDDAAFCTKCGRSLRTGVAAGGAVTYEVCEIVFQKKPAWKGEQFWARAVGPRGTYAAAEGERFNSWGLMKNYAPRRDALISALLADGWEPVPDKGPYWYSDKFRRAVRSFR